MTETPIVRPIRGRRSPTLGPLALMASNAQDLTDLCRAWTSQEERLERGLFNSRLLYGELACVVGPIIGAPYAVMLLETLVAWGVQRIVYAGWCGALNPALQIGDLLLPTQAVVDEGTSPAYGCGAGQVVRPNQSWCEHLERIVRSLGPAFHRGTIWSTDAVFRETPSRVDHFTDRGALAVEMEVSALFSAAHFLGVELAAILVVSGSLAGGRWQPGFGSPSFMHSRRLLCRRLGGLLNASSQAVR